MVDSEYYHAQIREETFQRTGQQIDGLGEEEEGDEGLPPNYLSTVTEEAPTRHRRFGKDSNAEGPEEVNL